MSTTIIQTILLGLLGLFSNAEWFLGTCYIQRPLILGPLTGLIMGDLQVGIIMGATMELAFAGASSIGGYVAWGVTSPLLPLAYYFGSDKVTALVGNMPEFISTGMDIAGGLLPAMGFAMLARMIMKKDVAPFFFIGYFVVAYSGMTTTGVALFAILILAVMFTMKKGVFGAGKATVVTGEKGGDFDEF